MISKKTTHVFEIIIIFIALPIVYLFDFLPGLWKIVPLLSLISYCLIILKKEGEIKSQDFKLTEVKIKDWGKIFIFPFSLFAILVLFLPDMMFADFENPKVLIAIIAYPLFSSLPQEVIYRKFFYSRYSAQIKRKSILLVLNALLFSFAHIYFQNYVALVLTFLGGIAFSVTYFRTKSLLFVSIEHSIYGLALLCSGMNQYFYKEF